MTVEVRPAFKFQRQTMDGVVYEALSAAYIAGEDESGDRIEEIAEALLEKVRNYMLTGDPHGRR